MFKFPYTNLHELNLDWILEKVKHFAELIPPMETAVDDVQSLTDDVAQAVEDANQAVEDAQSAIETAEEAKEIAEQAAQGTIADGAVTTVKLADEAVTTAKLDDGAVTGSKIDLATIQTGNLSEGCVTSNKILDGTIATVDIADGAITTVKLNNNAITTAKIADDAITASKIDFVSRVVTFPYSLAPGEALNSNLYSAINNDLPSGYSFFGIIGFATGGNTVNFINANYTNSAYSLFIINTGTLSITSNCDIYYIGLKSN